MCPYGLGKMLTFVKIFFLYKSNFIMEQNLVLDSVDFQILKLLVEDARISYAEIARRCSLTGATIQQRIKNLFTRSIIKGMRAIVEPQYLNLGVCAFVNIKITQPNMMESVIDALSSMIEVTECHAILGEFTLLLKVYCRNNTHLMEFMVDHVLHIPGVADTSSYISLKQFIDHPIPVFIGEDSGIDCCFASAI
jgi:Lrp/AsnC family transcriptional regulator for asnA, asnC and gidA